MAAGLIHSLILASSLAGGVHPGHARAASAHPVELGAPGASRSAHLARPRALAQPGWYLLYRPQHRRLHAAVAPAQRRVLRPGLLLHGTGLVRRGWVQIYDPAGKSWVDRHNLRPAAEPAWYRRLMNVSTLQRRPPVMRPRVSSIPLPPAGAAVVSAAAPAATPAPQTVVQVVVPQVAPTSIPDQIVAAGDYAWGPGQGQALLWIVERESGGNPYAVNPYSGACGLFQRLPCDVALGDVDGQVADGVAYVGGRYGSAVAAQLFWENNGWY